MDEPTRRSLLGWLGGGATAASAAVAGCALPTGPPVDERETVDDHETAFELRGHAFLENPPAFYTYGAVRADGRYGLVGGLHGEAGTFLVDIDDLDAPEQVHRLPSAATDRQNDVKFDPAVDVYYRSQEANVSDGAQGFQVVDYGYGDGSPEDPEVIATVETPRTGVHKLERHPGEPVLYAVDKAVQEPGLLVYDVSDPASPSLLGEVGPDGFCHDCEVEPGRELLHAAYVVGAFVGYVVYDVSDPADPVERGRVDYADRPDYREIGEPGFENCHQASFDPERDLAIVGDEVESGVPGGKHVYDVGWGEGSPEEPVHLGFTHSPNAQEMGDDESFFWTTHFHDVIPRDDRTLLVDGGYHEGAWLADITDPREPVTSQQFPTLVDDDRAEEIWDEADEVPLGSEAIHAPFAWSAVYNPARDFVLVSDSLTGVYVFEIDDVEFEPWSIETEIRRSYSPRDEIGERGLELARHYHEAHVYVPNTGNEVMTDEELQEIEDLAEEEE